MTELLLLGGPAHGATVELADSRSGVLVEGHGVPEGCAGRYRPEDARRRENGTYRFDGLTQIVGRLPLPREAA
jgi:hypothetical protein